MTSRRLGRWTMVLVAVAAAVAMAGPAPAAAARPSVAAQLDRLLAAGAIDPATREADRAVLDDARRRVRTLPGARRAELAGALRTVRGIAARGELGAGRLAPVFLTLARNAQWWSSGPLLAAGQRVSFAGSELVWRHVPGQGLQLHPLASFGKLNALAKGPRREDPRVARLLDELLSVAVPRGGGVAWEYYFAFGGGEPPWVSGLAQGTGQQAIARAGARLGRLDALAPTLSAGLDVFERPPPVGVRVDTPDGPHYAQYSFRPGLRVLNGFAQALIGLHDAAVLTGDPRAWRLFADGELRARVEVPAYDTGAWSLYSRGAVTRESDLGYHVLLRDFLAGLCARTGEPVYCTTRDRFTADLATPPVLRLVTARVRAGHAVRLRVALSKIARVGARITGPSGAVVAWLAPRVLGRGRPWLAWRAPRRPGLYSVLLDATDPAGNPAKAAGFVEVRPARRRARPRG